MIDDIFDDDTITAETAFDGFDIPIDEGKESYKPLVDYTPVEVMYLGGVGEKKLDIKTLRQGDNTGADALFKDEFDEKYTLMVNCQSVAGKMRYQEWKDITLAVYNGDDISPITVKDGEPFWG